MTPRVETARNYIRALRVLCYPVLLLSALLTIFLAFKFHLKFGLCNILFLFWTLAYLSVMEYLIPYNPKWNPTAREWRRDGIYLVITMIGGGSAVAVVFYIASLVKPINIPIPLGLEILLALGLSSLGSYAFHRYSHVHPWLWLLHGIHHVEEKVNVGNNGVNHILDVFGRRLLAQLPIILLGLSPSALFVVSVFNTLQGYFVHANVNTELGWLNYILVSPEQHRLHHSRDLAEAGHFSADIPLWDILFRSFTWKSGRKPQFIGFSDSDKFPLSDRIFASFLYPFRLKNRNAKAI